MLVAAVMVLSGCVSDAEDVTTTSPSPETPVNPWDLPLEERPDLFDPCAEIPVEAIEEALGGPVEQADLLHNYEPYNLHTCGWQTDEVLFGVVGTWKSKQQFLTDPKFGPFDTQAQVNGRPSIRAVDRTDQSENTCYQAFFTSRGTVMVNANSVSSLGEFQGERFLTGCEILDRSIGPIMKFVPEGDL